MTPSVGTHSVSGGQGKKGNQLPKKNVNEVRGWPKEGTCDTEALGERSHSIVVYF